MGTPSSFTRPPFFEALDAWKELLRQHRFSTDLLWLFDENLCFESRPEETAGFNLGYQTAFSPPPAEAEQVAYYHFAEYDFPVVWYRLGSADARSLCLLLSDKWFESRKDSAEFTRRDDWGMLFRPGGPEQIEEVTDQGRWENRLLRDRPLHDLDFCMSLQAVREIIVHGRALDTDERYGLKFLEAWRRQKGEQP